ncbi:LOW QUALITY PROTEIN: hypothetical protein Cgig2_024207 [Carnegiea gigantea]|uniref:Uncharacterized protein n=1 Tax=Carnegiea gigantea TaxID=171969 RepID=A0A9Q1GMD3_9CARY|nr:LOW QUALITY PROTEIN: hypothetical protein Cgig2_024207 [Carnegiea gigantea]
MELVVKEFENTMDEKNNGKGIRDLVVHYKDKVIRIMDVEMEKYNCIKLFRDARARVNESEIEFPKYTGFRYHPPNKKNQRWHFNISDDWVRLTNLGKCEEQVYSHIHPKLTSQQKSCNSPAKPASTSSPKPTTKASPPVQLKQKGKSSCYLPISPSPSPHAKSDCTPLQSTPDCFPLQSTPNEYVQLTSYPSRPQTKSSIKKPDSPTKSHTRTSVTKKPSSSITSKCPPLFNPLPLAALRVDELLNFDVGSLCRKPEWEVKENEWDDGREADISMLELILREIGLLLLVLMTTQPLMMIDEDFVGDGEETGDVDNSEDVSLDKENNSSESGDDEQLEVEVDQGMQLGVEIVNSDRDRDLVVNKMARTLRQGTLWIKNRDGKVSLLLGYIFTCKEDLLVDRTTWMVKSHNGRHICGRPDQNRMVTTPLVSKFLLRYFIVAPKMDVKEMQKIMMRKYGIYIPEHTCWRARKMMKHAGIIKASGNVMPTALKRTCVIHYYKNFASLYPGAWFHAFFYIAANAYDPFVHEKVMKKTRDKDPGAYHWLTDNEKLELWARFKFDTNLKCDDNTNNFVEGFNHAVVKFRGLPILTMLEEIRTLIGSRFVKRFEKSQKWNDRLIPYVRKKLLMIEMDSRNCTLLVHAGQGEFDMTKGHTNFAVRLQDKFYDCRK